MLQGHNGRRVTLIGLFGSESIGKTSTGYWLTGMLRREGALAELVSDSSGALPFPPDRFDTHEEAWVHVLGRKLARETEVALRLNVDTIVSDRTPLDLLAYASLKHPHSYAIAAFEEVVMEWMRRYDALYFFPAEGTSFRAEGFREATDDSRRAIDSLFQSKLPELTARLPNLVVAGGDYNTRAEFVLRDLKARFSWQAP